MPNARWKMVGLSLALVGLLAGWWLARDGGDEAPPSVGGGAEVSPKASAEPRAVAGDPLLQRAREGIRAGMLPEALQAEMLGSTAPEHARAQRVLLAMNEPSPGVEDPAEDDEGSDDARLRPPPILPPSEVEAATLPVPAGAGGERSEGGGDRAEGTKASGPASTDRPVRTPKLRADLGGLTLKSSKRGATLTIAAPSSLVVGVANQPASGLVRLVIESAQAGSAVLHARPKTDGAEVTGVRQGQGTVQITIRLEPGWSFDSVQPFSGGAKVHLVAPP